MTWLFGFLEASPNIQHLCNLIKLTVWAFFDAIQLSFLLVHHAWTMIFSINVIVEDPFFIASDNSFQKRIYYIMFEIRITNIHSFRVMCFFFNSYGTSISSFLSPRHLILTFLQSLAELYDNSIQLSLSFDRHQCQIIINFTYLFVSQKKTILTLTEE